jgi:hypothetical protein
MYKVGRCVYSADCGYFFKSKSHLYFETAVQSISSYSYMNEKFVRNGSELGDIFHVTEGRVTYYRPTVVRHISYKIVDL